MEATINQFESDNRARSEIRKELDSCRDEFNDLQNTRKFEKSNLETELTNLRMKNSQLNSMNSNFKIEKSKFEIELNTLHASIRALETSKSQLLSENSDLKTAKNQIERENESLKHRIRNAEICCEDGFGRLNDQCIDFDEFCMNGQESSKSCSDGYENKCTDIDECSTGAHDCDSNANCKNLRGSYECTCDTNLGFYGNGKTCSTPYQIQYQPPIPNDDNSAYSNNRIGIQNSISMIQPEQQAAIIYIIAIPNGDNLNTLFHYIESFYDKMIALTADMITKPEFRLVHRATKPDLTTSRWRRSSAPDWMFSLKEYTCEVDGLNELGYMVTDIKSCIAVYYSFESCFRTKVSESANAICVGNAYHALYEDLARESERIALQFSVQPFSVERAVRFRDEAVYKFSSPGAMSYSQLLIECNKDDVFADSALIITDARYNHGRWKDSFEQRVYAWTELNKCVLSNAQNAPRKYEGMPSACSNYLRRNQPENALINVDKRKECPMIPDSRNSFSKNLLVLIAEKFFETLNVYSN